MAALRAAGWRRQPPASCGLTGRAMDDRSAGVLAGGAPSSDNPADQCAIDRRATAWMARRCAVLGREARHIRAWVVPCPMGREPGKDARLPIAPSRTNARWQDVADAAQSPAARRAAKNKPSHRPDLHKGSRQDAGVDGVYEHPVQAAGRGVDAQTWTGTRCDPRTGAITSIWKGTGQEARFQQAAGRGGDAHT